MRTLFFAITLAIFSSKASASTLVYNEANTFSLQEDSITNNTDVEETTATFPGGQNSLYSYLSKSFRYPEEAQELNVQGRVYVSFIVSENGKIKDVKVAALNDIEGETEEEIINLCVERYKKQKEATGKLVSKSEIKKVRSAYNSLIQEAKRIISKMPDWVPATQNGNPVSSTFKFPITFRLS